MTVSLLLLSFAAGLLVGLTGIGGGTLIAPVLILVFRVPPLTTVGTDLVCGGISKLAGSIVHLRQGTVDLHTVRRLLIGSVPGGIIGVGLVEVLPGAGYWVRRGIAIVLLFVAFRLFLRILCVPPEPATGLPDLRSSVGISIYGAAVGFCVGFTSVGSGCLLAPLLLRLNKSRPANAVGTDVCHATVLAMITAPLYIKSKQVAWDLLPPLLSGAIPGILLGSRLVRKVAPQPLRIGLATILFISAYLMV